MNTTDYVINNQVSLKVALEKLNSLENHFTLFVIDKNKVVIGTLTDGDIRRGLIKGYNVEESVDKFVFKKFRHLKEGELTPLKIKQFKKLKLKVVPLLNSKNQLIKLGFIALLSINVWIIANKRTVGNGFLFLERRRETTNCHQ